MDTPAKLDQKCEGAGKMVQGSEFSSEGPRVHVSWYLVLKLAT